MKKMTTKKIIKKKQNKEKVVAVTAYDYSFARIIDQCDVDLILVGDSLSNVFAGYKTTLPITLDEMIYHCKAVRRGVENSLLIGDLPFLSYHISREQAIQSAGRMMKEAEVEGVKLEGGEAMADIIYRLTQIGIPVMGHLGFTPQSEHKFGGRRVQAKNETEVDRLAKDAKILEESGAFCVVLELIPLEAARKITTAINIPTIGIGAGPHCDGQILVHYDLLGIDHEFNPKFLRKYANLHEVITNAVKTYSSDVKSGGYPADSESY